MLTTDAKIEIGTQFFEAQLAIEAAAMGAEALFRGTEDHRDKAKLGALLRLVTQAADALEALHTSMAPLLDPDAGAGLDAPELATEALGYYADSTNYHARKDKPAPVMVDGGKKARAALAVIEGEADED